MTDTDTTAMAHVPLAEAAMTWNTLTMVCRTELVPKAYRNRPDAALGAVLMGRELGLCCPDGQGTGPGRNVQPATD